jgi:hypothetical protein
LLWLRFSLAKKNVTADDWLMPMVSLVGSEVSGSGEDFRMHSVFPAQHLEPCLGRNLWAS